MTKNWLLLEQSSVVLVPKDYWGFTGFKDFDFGLHVSLQMVQRVKT
jgi:hypothetical protein